MTYALEELTAASLGRQFPAEADEGADVVDLVARTGPIQSQTARSPFIGLAARRPGTTHAEISQAYAEGRLVRGSVVRGTVHTATSDQHAALDVATRVGQRPLWNRLVQPTTFSLEELWASTESFAGDAWRSPEELADHLDGFLRGHGAVETADRLASQQVGRYLAFGHGGLVRRPVAGSWSGQGRPAYRAVRAIIDRPTATLDDAVALHVRCHGPVSRHDIAWWSGLGLTVVDEILDRLGLDARPGPDAKVYVDVPDAPAGRDLPGVRLLPEFDALMCGYHPSARDRFADPAHLRRLWAQSNGTVLPPLLVDGRITGFWRASGSARRRPLDIVWFVGTRKPRRSELSAPIAALEAALDITVSQLTLTREQA